MEKKDNKEQIWILLFIVFPVVFLMNIGELFTDDSSMQVLYGALLGGVGGGIGLGIYQIVKTRTNLIKGITLAVFLTIILTIIKILAN